MLEKRKDESEAVQKYQGFLVTAVIAAFLVFMAPFLVEFVTGTPILDADGNLLPPNATSTEIPSELTSKIGDIFGFVLWIVRIIIIFAIMMFVVLLRLDVRARPQIPQI